MPTLFSLTSKIQTIIQDASISDIVTRINDCATMVAAGVRLPNGQISSPLPELLETDTVSTTINAYVDLPDNYQRNVFYIADSSGDRIFPPSGGYYSFMNFLNSVTKKDLSEAGSVYRVCVRGKKLYYQGIPSSSEDLTIHYYKKPTEVVEDGDTIEGIPEHLQTRIIFNYVVADIQGSMLEDGENSLKMGTTYHMNEYYNAMVDLCDFVGIDAEPVYYGQATFVDGGVCD